MRTAYSQKGQRLNPRSIAVLIPSAEARGRRLVTWLQRCSHHVLCGTFSVIFKRKA